MRTEPGFLGSVPVCSCATSSGVDKVRKISRKLGNLPMSLITRNGNTTPTGFEPISHVPAWGTVTNDSVSAFQIRQMRPASKRNCRHLFLTGVYTSLRFCFAFLKVSE